MHSKVGICIWEYFVGCFTIAVGSKKHCWWRTCHIGYFMLRQHSCDVIKLFHVETENCSDLKYNHPYFEENIGAKLANQPLRLDNDGKTWNRREPNAKIQNPRICPCQISLWKKNPIMHRNPVVSCNFLLSCC